MKHAEHVQPTDNHLSSRGLLQAAALVETFKASETTFDVVYTNLWCIETAKSISRALGIPLEVDERLKGDDELAEEQAETPDSGTGQRDSLGAERPQSRYNRVSEFLKSIEPCVLPLGRCGHLPRRDKTNHPAATGSSSNCTFVCLFDVMSRSVM